MRRDWGPLALISQLGVTIVASILLGLLVGLWIDAHFGTRPWATLVFSLLGIAAGTIGVYRLIARSIEEATAERPARKNQDRPED